MDTTTKLKVGSFAFCLILLLCIYSYFYGYLIDVIDNNESLLGHCIIINIFLCFLMLSSCCFLSSDYYQHRQTHKEYSRLNTILVIGFLLIVFFSVASIELLDPHILTISKIHWITAFISCIPLVLLVCHFQFGMSTTIVIVVSKNKNSNEPNKANLLFDADSNHDIFENWNKQNKQK